MISSYNIIISKSNLSYIVELQQKQFYQSCVFKILEILNLFSINKDEIAFFYFNTVFFLLQQDYTTLRAFSYRDSDVFVVCYSTVDRESFNNIKSFWVPEIKKHNVKKRPVILVATQTDMKHESDDHITSLEGVELAKDIGAECLIETSALTKEGTNATFEKVVLSALKHQKKKYKIFNKFFRK